MPRGGKREGAGRPAGTGKFGEPTKSIRIPLSDLARAIVVKIPILNVLYYNERWFLSVDMDFLYPQDLKNHNLF